MSVTGLIMASGFSNRMGKDKLLMEVRGKPMVEHVILECKKSNLEDIVLVYREDKVRDLGIKYGIKTIFNPLAHLGQSESIKLGISQVATEGVMFLTGDQPYLDHRLLDSLIEKFINSRFKIVVPIYEGKQYTPTIFSMDYKDQFLSLEGDNGGKKILLANQEDLGRVEVLCKKWVLDIDTKSEYEKWG